MAITVQMQFTSAVTEIYQDAFVGSSIENGTTIIQFDLRKHDFHQELGTRATLCWRKESYHVDVHELSTFHNPILYRFIGTFHETATVVNSLFGETWRIIEFGSTNCQLEFERCRFILAQGSY